MQSFQFGVRMDVNIALLLYIYRDTHTYILLSRPEQGQMMWGFRISFFPTPSLY